MSDKLLLNDLFQELENEEANNINGGRRRGGWRLTGGFDNSKYISCLNDCKKRFSGFAQGACRMACSLGAG